MTLVYLVVTAVGAAAVVAGFDGGVDAVNLVVAAVVAVVGVAVKLRERALSGPLRRIAAANGWTFSERGAVAAGWRGAPFDLGSRRRTSSVVRGMSGGRHMTAFNLDVSSGRKRDRTDGWYAVVALEVDAPFPSVEVRATGGAAGQLTGVGGIDFESEDFNRRYRVTCVSPKLASDVLHPRTLELLVARHPITFRIGDGRAVAWSTGRLEPLEVLAWSSTLNAVIDGIPSFVWADRGGSANGGVANSRGAYGASAGGGSAGPGLTAPFEASRVDHVVSPKQESP